MVECLELIEVKGIKKSEAKLSSKIWAVLGWETDNGVSDQCLDIAAAD